MKILANICMNIVQYVIHVIQKKIYEEGACSQELVTDVRKIGRNLSGKEKLCAMFAGFCDIRDACQWWSSWFHSCRCICSRIDHVGSCH